MFKDIYYIRKQKENRSIGEVRKGEATNPFREHKTRENGIHSNLGPLC